MMKNLTKNSVGSEDFKSLQIDDVLNIAAYSFMAVGNIFAFC